MENETCKLHSSVFWIFLPNIIKIDSYNFELHRSKVGPFFETQCSVVMFPNPTKCYSWFAQIIKQWMNFKLLVRQQHGFQMCCTWNRQLMIVDAGLWDLQTHDTQYISEPGSDDNDVPPRWACTASSEEQSASASHHGLATTDHIGTSE